MNCGNTFCLCGVIALLIMVNLEQKVKEKCNQPSSILPPPALKLSYAGRELSDSLHRNVFHLEM